jgi:hypothetical protein
MKLTAHLHVLLRLGMSGVVPPLHPVPLWHAHGLFLTMLVDSAVVVVEVSKLKYYSVKMQEVFVLHS